MVSIHPQIFNSIRLLSNLLRIVPSTTTTISITITFRFHIFQLSDKIQVFIFVFVFFFTLLSAGTVISTRWQIPFLLLTQGLVFWIGLSDYHNFFFPIFIFFFLFILQLTGSTVCDSKKQHRFEMIKDSYPLCLKEAKLNVLVVQTNWATKNHWFAEAQIQPFKSSFLILSQLLYIVDDDNNNGWQSSSKNEQMRLSTSQMLYEPNCMECGMCCKERHSLQSRHQQWNYVLGRNCWRWVDWTSVSIHLRLSEGAGLCSLLSYKPRGTQVRNHCHTGDSPPRHAATCLAGAKLPTWCVMSQVVCILKNHKIYIPFNFSFKFWCPTLSLFSFTCQQYVVTQIFTSQMIAAISKSNYINFSATSCIIRFLQCFSIHT